MLQNGFTMHKNKNVKKVFYWECRQRTHKKNGTGENAKCSARCTTKEKDGKHFLVKASEHNHAPEIGEKIYLENNEYLKRQALTTNDKPSQIIQTAKANVPTTSINSFPIQ